MPEYIEREEALACFHDWIDRRGDVHTPDEMEEYRALESLPDADVRPVVRGKWIKIKYRSICRDCSFRGFASWNFCPNCGADMREER